MSCTHPLVKYSQGTYCAPGLGLNSGSPEMTQTDLVLEESIGQGWRLINPATINYSEVSIEIKVIQNTEQAPTIPSLLEL